MKSVCQVKAIAFATPSNCLDIPLSQQYRSWFERTNEHQGESRGYGNNLLNRDNGQPNAKGSCLSVQFTD
jgi:hypothetical protein